MTQKQRRSGRVIVVPLGIVLLLAGRGAIASDSCVSAQCHATLTSAKDVHPAAESCDACHQAAATPHPQKDKKTFKLTEAQPGLCYSCHDAFGKKSHVHPPVKDGDCTTCHDPHASAQPKLLKQPAGDLCKTCHADKTEAKVVHAPVSSGDCTDCHTPHESDAKGLLVKKGAALCEGCHDIITKAMKTLHGPIAEGECTPCHNPHGGEYAKLLVRDFPTDRYAPYTDKAYDLCFGCHDRALVAERETASATHFRDGDRNLHSLHVNDPQRGRSCRLCHDIHGGPSALLVADSVSFGEWTLPVKFVKTATGGRCAPGCHKPQSYDETKSRKKHEATRPVKASTHP